MATATAKRGSLTSGRVSKIMETEEEVQQDSLGKMSSSQSQVARDRTKPTNYDISGKVEEVYKMLTVVDDKVEHLFNRLEPVLPDGEFDDSDRKGQSLEGASSLYRKLSGVVNRLTIIADHLDAIEFNVQL